MVDERLLVCRSIARSRGLSMISGITSHRNPCSLQKSSWDVKYYVAHCRKFNSLIFAIRCSFINYSSWDNDTICFANPITLEFSSPSREKERFNPLWFYHLFSRKRLFLHGTDIVNRIIRPGRRWNFWSRLRRSATYASIFVIINCCFRKRSSKFSTTIRTSFQSADIELSSKLPFTRLCSHYWPIVQIRVFLINVSVLP